MKRTSFSTIFLVLPLAILLYSCGRDEAVPAPSAKAPTTVAASNPARTFVWSFEAADERIKTDVGERSGGMIKATAKAGALSYGPPIELAAGRYRVRWFGAFAPESSDEPVTVDAYWNGKGQISTQAKRSDQQAPDTNAPFAQLAVDLAQPVKDFQTRVWAATGTRLALARYEVIPE